MQLNFSKAPYKRELELFGDRILPKADLEAACTQYEKDMPNLQAVQTGVAVSNFQQQAKQVFLSNIKFDL